MNKALIAFGSLVTFDANSWLVIFEIISHLWCELLPLEYVSRCRISLFVGSAEEVEGGDQLSAGFSLASVIHEPSWRRAGKGAQLVLCSLLVRELWRPLLRQTTLLYTKVASCTPSCFCLGVHGDFSLGPGLWTLNTDSIWYMVGHGEQSQDSWGEKLSDSLC